MKKRLSHSHLQNRILLYIEHNEIGSLAGLARELNAHRSSVSRAAHALQVNGLVSKINGRWSLTLAGEEEAHHLRRQLPERATKAVEKVNRLIEQGKLAALASNIVSLGATSPYAAISEAAKLSLDAAVPESIQPLMGAAAMIDLFTSTEEAMQSLARVVARVDSLGLAEEAMRPLANLYAGIGSLTLAQEAIQPLVSAATRYDSLALGQKSVPSMLKATEEVGQLASALKTMSSALLVPAFDSIISLSLKPSITEIAADQALQAMEDYTQSALADLCPQLIREALASFSQSQRLSLASIEQVSVLGNAASSIIREFSEANIRLSGIVSDLGAISMQSLAINSDMATLMPNVTEIARTYKGYLVDVVGGLGQSFIDHRMAVGIVVPTRTTSAYVSSVKTAALFGEVDIEEIALSEARPIPWRDRAAQLDDVFWTLGPKYITMWHGSWMVLDSQSPDRIRQAAHSGRELLMQTLAALAPDSVFDDIEVEKYGYQGKVTRNMRIKKILAGSSRSAVSWVNAVAKALDETYDRLADMSHDRNARPRTTEQQIAGLLCALGGLLCFMIHSDTKCR